jgi:hypothetical protein
MQYVLNMLSSVFSFLNIYIILTLSINFWGLVILKLTKLKIYQKIGEHYTLTAGLAAICFITWSTNIFISNFFYLLTIILYLGFLGYLILALFFVKKLLSVQNKLPLSIDTIKKYDLFLISLLTAVIFSFFYSAIWPSGRMDFWMFSSADYYNWSLACDFWLGRVDTDIIRLTGGNQLQMYDSFGSSLIFGLFSVASGQSALWAIPGFLATVAVWTTTAIMALIRRLFGFGLWPSWLLALGVTGGAFFNYQIFMGLVGQMVAGLAFLAALDELMAGGRGKPRSHDVTRALIPVLLLFLAYPGGFFAYFAVLTMAACLIGFFRSETGPLVSRISGASRAGVGTLVLVLLLCLLLAPFEGFHLFTRSLATYSQKAGWLLPLISPWLVSGLPVFDHAHFLDETVIWSGPLYALLIPAVLALSWSLWRRPGPDRPAGGEPGSPRPGPDKPAIVAIALTFVISILGYIFVYFFRGNSYQVWKFASFCALPLSFIFPALLYHLFLTNFNKILKKVLIFVFIIVLLFIPYRLSLYRPITSFAEKFYLVKPPYEYINIISSILSNIEPGSTILIDIVDDTELFLTMEFFKTIKFFNPILLNPNWAFFSVPIGNYGDPLRNDNYVIISRSDFPGLFNGHNTTREDINVHFYSNNWIKEHGYVVLYGVNQGIDWFLLEPYLTARVGLPEALIGQPVKLSIDIEPAEGSDPGSGFCGYSARLAFQEKGGPSWVETPVGRVEGVADASMTSDGVLTATVRLDREAARKPASRCRLTLKSVRVDQAGGDEVAAAEGS